MSGATALAYNDDRGSFAVSARGEAMPTAGRAIFAGICALIVAAPFERLEPLMRLPSQSVTTLESLVLVVLVAGLIGWLGGRLQVRWRTPVTTPWLVLLLAAAISAIAAPVYRENAFHMVGRLAIALA